MLFGGQKYIVGLDIGTATVKAVVAEDQHGHPVIRAVFERPSSGVKKGVIVDLAEATSAVNKILTDVSEVSNAALKTVYVSVGTWQIKSQVSRGIIAVSRADSEIYEYDIERARKASEAISLPMNRMIVHNIPREYIVDGVGDIQDPLGLSGNRLELNALVVDAFAPHVKSIIRVVELAGGKVAGLVLSPMADSRATLTRPQKDLGTVVIDLGAGTTGVSIYEENKLVNIAVFPVGAGHVTNDIALRLKIPVAAAERLKIEAGYALAGEVNAREAIELSKYAAEMRSVVSRRLVAETIEARLAEIFGLVYDELKLAGKNGQLPGGAILVGGGAKLPGITDLARQELKLSAQIGLALGEEWPESHDAEAFEDPGLVTALGLVLEGVTKEGWQRDAGHNFFKNPLRYFWP